MSRSPGPQATLKQLSAAHLFCIIHPAQVDVCASNAVSAIQSSPWNHDALKQYYGPVFGRNY